ncbi:MAG: HAMP domain-containing histidine kinase [Saprospiraceae bacterium]|nr:HAMP domain-containing histidine kinase [Saprospiraceae bacterium]
MKQVLYRKQLLPIIVSMLLLALFLGIYLFRNYQSADKELKKQAQLYLENAFKTAESQIFDKMIIELKGYSVFQKDSALNDLKWIEQVSMVHSDTFQSKGIKSIFLEDHVSKAIIKTRKDSVISDSNFNIKIAINSNSMNLDTTITGKDKVDLETVKNIFDINIKKNGFAIHYILTNDSSKTGRSDNPKYNEVFTGQQFFLNVDENKLYLFRKIMPDLLLSSLLFLAMSFTFYYIFSSNKRNQELYELKDDFVRNMTHELKTPLATMSVAIEALQSFREDADKNLTAEYLRIAESENQKLSHLVDKVLSISKHLDNESLHVENINLPQLIHEVSESFKLRFDQKGIYYSFINNLKTSNFYSNPQVIAMTLHNLLDNAIKYIDTESPEIILECRDDEKNIFISVKDNGKAISKEHSERIFEKFYRIPQGNIHNIKGHGLGLYIVQKLLSSIKAIIRLESNDQGNQFNIQIPKLISAE